MYNTNYKRIIRGEDDFLCTVEIIGHNGLVYIPQDFKKFIIYIYTTNRNINIECSEEDGHVMISDNGQYYIVIDRSELEELDYGQIRYKFYYEIQHHKQPDHTLQGSDFGGTDTWLVDEIINN
jgi:hypothetical protein